MSVFIVKFRPGQASLLTELSDCVPQMLVCCGLLDEAVWFARELGDWRTALLVCVLNSQLPARKHRSDCAVLLSHVHF